MSNWCTSHNRSSRTCGCKYHRNIKAPRNSKTVITQVRVDDATKAEIIAKLGLKATYLTSDTVGFNYFNSSYKLIKLCQTVTSPRANVTSRLEEVLEQTHVISTDAVDSRSMVSYVPGLVLYMRLTCLKLPWSPLISSRSNYYDPFSHVAPQTCFPVPYPPPPPESCLPRNTLPTSFISPTPSRVVRSLASHSLDMSTLTNLFERMNTTALEANARIPRSHKVSFVPDSDKTKLLPPFLSPSVADNSTKPHLTSVESIASPTKPTNTPRRRKIASLPTRRSKTSACLSPPRIDLAEATSYSTSRDVEETPSTHTHAKQLVPALPSPYTYTAEAPCFATPKYSTPRQRRVHTLRKTIPRPQTVPQNQTLNLTTAEETSYNISRFPPVVSDATSYFDSPSTSSDELDTPPSTPPSSHVLLASTSTESLVISSESERIVSHKEPLGDTKLLYQRLRYRRLDFTKGGLGRDEQPLTFTFSV